MSRTRIGVIGAGWWATESHIPVLQALPDVEVTCICGLEREHLQKVQQKFRIRHATENYEELLARDDLDGVVVSSPTPFTTSTLSQRCNEGFRSCVRNRWRSRHLKPRVWLTLWKRNVCPS
jgi:predicted dehydrogenase